MTGLGLKAQGSLEPFLRSLHASDERAGRVDAALELLEDAVGFEALEDAGAGVGGQAEQPLGLVHGQQ